MSASEIDNKDTLIASTDVILVSFAVLISLTVKRKFDRNILENVWNYKFAHTKKTLWPLFMDGVQLPQCYRATTRRRFTFCHLVPRNSWCSFDRPRKDERLSQSWSHPVVLNKELLGWESSNLTTTSLLHRSIVQEERVSYMAYGKRPHILVGWRGRTNSYVHLIRGAIIIYH